MKYKFKILSLLILFVFVNQVDAQLLRYGLPGLTNFSRSEYNAGTQNWCMGQASNGMIYFANNSGLLEFDGQHWRTYNEFPLMYRSMCVDNKRIYIGAFNEIGFYEPDNAGQLKYHSLNYLVKNQIGDLDEIWRIHKTSFGIVFQSFKGIFIYDKNKIHVVLPRSKFHFSYYVNGILWVYDETEGLMQYRDGKVRRIPDGGFFAGTQIWTILPVNDDQVIIGTAKNGLYIYDGVKVKPWDKQINGLLKRYQIFSGALIQNKYYAFGTIQNGLIVADRNGNVVLEINRERGLQNNTILSMGTDREGNIWLGLDNGISLVDFNSPVTFIQNYFDLGTGYASVRFKDNLYLGTNQGLFYIKWTDFLNPLKQKESFKLIQGMEGQVWNLSVIDNTLLCGHNNGAFQIQGDKAQKISSADGTWTFLKINDNKLIAGTYSGLSVYEKNGNQWKYLNDIVGFKEGTRFLQIDKEGYIWITHWYKGVFRLKLDKALTKVVSIKLFNRTNGILYDKGINLFKIKNDLAFATDSGIYRFNDVKMRFEVDPKYLNLFMNKQRIDVLYEDSGSNIWFYRGQQAGVCRSQEDGTYKSILAPFSQLTGKIIGFGHINSLDTKNVIFGIEGGFAHYNSEYNKDYVQNFVVHINDFHSKDTAEGAFRFNSNESKQNIVPEFRFKNNVIAITYSASFFEDHQVFFQYKLKGFDDIWSDWTSKTFKEYTNLHEGSYTFSVRARNVFGTISPDLNYSFILLPPWYRSTLAWIIYLLILAGIVYQGTQFFKRSMDKSRLKEKERQREKFKEREQHLKEEALIAEKEMIRLRNETLKSEMQHKEKELANSTMHIIQKNNSLNKVKTDLKNMVGAVEDDQVKNRLNSAIKRVNKEIDSEKQWMVFDTHVEQVHQDLFKTLKARYPELSPRELKLCAYLRMNISSKEIATLMNISTRGVEISRYRIRKKLGLDRNANLTEFMLSI
jgi:DNA-binding CsgD family transcriptional regulator/ligand-binding sensor domain-containing protein